MGRRAIISLIFLRFFAIKTHCFLYQKNYMLIKTILKVQDFDNKRKFCSGTSWNRDWKVKGGVGGWDDDDFDELQDLSGKQKFDSDAEMVKIGKKSSTDSRTDEEILAAMKAEQQEKNDLWQFGTFSTLCSGIWHGIWTSYTVSQFSEQGGDFFPEEPMKVKTCYSRSDDHGDDLQPDSTLKITYHSDSQVPALSQLAQSKLVPKDFRGLSGNLVNKESFTLGKQLEDYVTLEIGIVDGKLRMRSILIYKKANSGCFTLNNFYLCRESLDGFPEPGTEPLYGDGGTGIYDIPHVSEPQNYLTLYAEGLVTLRFPTTIMTEEKGVISLDWTPSKMRYQVDRVFMKFDGSVHALEVIEISKEYAKTYAPQFKS